MIRRIAVLAVRILLLVSELLLRLIGNVVFQVVGTITMAVAVVANIPASYHVAHIIIEPIFPAAVEAALMPFLMVGIM